MHRGFSCSRSVVASRLQVAEPQKDPGEDRFGERARLGSLQSFVEGLLATLVAPCIVAFIQGSESGVSERNRLHFADAGATVG